MTSRVDPGGDVRLVIRAHRPWRRVLLVTAGILLLGAAGWMLFDYGQWRHIYQRMAASDETRDLWRVSRELERDNARLREQLAMLQRSAEVDRQALAGLQEQVGRLQGTIAELREELSFYRGVLSGTRERSGYHVQGVKLTPGADPRHYAYKLVLTHAVKDDRKARGTLALAAQGTLDGREERLALALQPGSSRTEKAFEFRHFRRFQGSFELPEGFHAERLLVTIEAQQGGEALLETGFDWDAVSQ